MAKTEENLKSSEDFIRGVLERHFKQKIAAEELRAAAERLCEALPNVEREAVAA
jgi:hypothetical protein